MRIVASGSANLTAAEVAAYDVALLPTRLMVDGVEHDVRTSYALSQVDDWVRSARVRPHNVGATASELVEILLKLSSEDPELLLVLPTRKIIGTYQAAVSAERILKSRRAGASLRLAIIELRSTDCSGALTVTYAGEARKAGLSFERVVEATRAFAEGSHVAIVPRQLDSLVKGGHATFLRAMVANLVGRSPVLVMDDGELKASGSTRRDESIPALVAALQQRVASKRRIWAAVSHGSCEADARILAAEMERHYRVEHLVLRPCSPPTYLHLGPQALVAFACAVDELPWNPPRL